MRYYNLRYSRKRIGIHKLEISSRLDRRSNEARGRNHESRWESTNIPCNRGWLIVRYPKVIRFPIELQIKAGEKMAEERYYWRREIMLAAAPIERYLRGERTREREREAEGEISNAICMRGGIRVTSELAADMNVRRLIRTPPVWLRAFLCPRDTADLH